jgi:hypothetical protein
MSELPGYDDWLDNHGNPGIEPCEHEFISWHGMRGECQDCGEIVAVAASHMYPGIYATAYPVRIGLVYGE